MNEKILEEVLRKLNILLDETNGLKLSGQGMIANNTAKTNEILDLKVQKFLYFMEKRQKKEFAILCKIAGLNEEEGKILEEAKI